MGTWAHDPIASAIHSSTACPGRGQDAGWGLRVLRAEAPSHRNTMPTLRGTMDSSQCPEITAHRQLPHLGHSAVLTPPPLQGHGDLSQNPG